MPSEPMMDMSAADERAKRKDKKRAEDNIFMVEERENGSGKGVVVECMR